MSRQKLLETLVDSTPGINGELEGPRPQRPSDSGTLAELLQDQNEVLVQMVEKQGEVIESLAALQSVLSRIDSRQAAADHSWQPIPQIPATSSSAWNPLYDSLMQKTIIPVVDRWKSSLDTLLIFIALFSAIVTTFYIQSSSGLSPDAAFETNQLIANLTDVVILLSGLNSSQLGLPAPVAFEPEASTLRLNFYWSTSIVLSISVASLAVASRGYLALFTRSRHRETYKELVDIRRRWQYAKRQLGPLVDALPQLLIISVLLFLTGLLDSLVSNWLSSSPRSGLSLASAILAAINVAAAGIIIIYTFIHGCLHPSTSPFQSTASHYAEICGRHLSRLYRSLMNRRRPLMNVLLEGAAPERAVHEELQAYHASVQTTHDDASLDLAAAALLNTLKLDLKFSLHRGRSLVLSDQAVQTLHFFLSPEASIRSNVTAALSIGQIYDYGGFWRLCDKSTMSSIMLALISAAERCSATTTGLTHSSLLWNSHFSNAMAYIVANDWDAMKRDFSGINGTIRLLLADYRDLPQIEVPLRERVADHALSVTKAKLLSILPLSSQERDWDVDETAWDFACDTVLIPFAPVIQAQTCQEHLERGIQAFISSKALGRTDARPVTYALVRWFSKTLGTKFAVLVIQSIVHCLENVREHPQIHQNDVLEQLTVFEASPDPVQDSDAQLVIREVLKLIAAARKALTSEHPDQIVTRFRKSPCCKENELYSCDFFCFYRPSIVRLLEKARSLAVGLPLTDVDSLDMTWEELSLTLAPVMDSEDPMGHHSTRGPTWPITTFRPLTTLIHRNKVKANLLEEFRPFFMPTPTR